MTGNRSLHDILETAPIDKFRNLVSKLRAEILHTNADFPIPSMVFPSSEYEL